MLTLWTLNWYLKLACLNHMDEFGLWKFCFRRFLWKFLNFWIEMVDKRLKERILLSRIAYCLVQLYGFYKTSIGFNDSSSNSSSNSIAYSSDFEHELEPHDFLMNQIRTCKTNIHRSRAWSRTLRTLSNSNSIKLVFEFDSIRWHP